MPECYLGVDLGTSGARAIVIDASGQQRSEGKSALTEHGQNHRDPQVWWSAVRAAVHAALAGTDPQQIVAFAIDGTSGTMLPIDASGQPLAEALMYNDPCTDSALLERITNASPDTTAARGATSSLARVARFSNLHPAKTVHQADWIARQFSPTDSDPIWTSDENNALKTGYDPISGTWPDWVAQIVDPTCLPRVVAPGTAIGTIGPNEFGLPESCKRVAGTTDGCASFLATGANQPGDGVSALGTTLTLKLLSDTPVFAPEYGIYSHKILGLWLAGGASNTGGNVLLSAFPNADLTALSTAIDPETDTGLSYYPLSKPGERFPINDPHHPPVLGPRPASDSEHLKAIFEGIAAIEALAYTRLADLGAPALRSVRTVGGGASNPIWTRIRERRLNTPMPAPLSNQAAYGTALLAKAGA